MENSFEEDEQNIVDVGDFEVTTMPSAVDKVADKEDMPEKEFIKSM
jgi:hypothetical protein